MAGQSVRKWGQWNFSRRDGIGVSLLLLVVMIILALFIASELVVAEPFALALTPTIII